MRTPAILITLGFLFMAGCSQTGTTSANASRVMTNSELEQAVEARLNSDPELSAAKLDVDADSKDNKVTLKGTVPTETMRRPSFCAAFNRAAASSLI